ncbi:MAG TPA: PD-(D/E)XK nuclease family protein [Syntrophales bacterium]|nr:PD-(D/E)XK nuclease family protein [Syntrophales bacterium]
MDNIRGLPLFLHGRRIYSDYQLIGHDENALTFALGHCLSQDRRFLSAFLKMCQFKGVTADAEIYLQRRERDSGIVDLEIVIHDRLQLIVEAKVGGDYPSIGQIRKYIKRLDQGIESKVIILTVITDDKARNRLKHQFGKQIGFVTWPDILKLSKKLAVSDESTFNVRTLSIFMKEVYNMSINAQEEVWIVPLSTTWKAKSTNISVADFHVQHRFWVMGGWKTRRSIYMGFRYNGYLQYIGRIIQIDRELKSSKIVPKYPKISREFWPQKDGPFDVVRLGKLVPFPKKLKSGNIHSRHIYCDFDLLLTADSILEAESFMKERRLKKKDD